MKNTTYFLLIIGLLFISLGLFASYVNINYQWIHQYDGKTGDTNTCLIENSLGQIVSIGYTENIKFKRKDILVNVLTKEGELVLEKNVGGLEDEQLFDIVEHKNGYVGVGTAGIENMYPWLVFFDQQFNILSDQTFSNYQGGRFNKIIIDNNKLICIGHNGSKGLVIKTSIVGEVEEALILPKEGEIVDGVIRKDDLFILSNRCIDCFSAKKVESLLSKLPAVDFSKKLETNLLPFEAIEIGKSIQLFNGNFIIGGLIFDPRLNIQASVLAYDFDNDKNVRSANFGKNWEDELIGIELLDNNKISLYGKSLSDPDSRKRRETYKAWKVDLDDQFLITNEVYFGDGKFGTFNDMIITLDGTACLVGSNEDLPIIINIGKMVEDGNKTSLNGLILKESYYEEVVKDDILNPNEVIELNLVIANNSDEQKPKFKLDLKVESIGQNLVDIPPYVIVPKIKPHDSHLVTIPIKGIQLEDGSITLKTSIGETVFLEQKFITKAIRETKLEFVESMTLSYIDTLQYQPVAKIDVSIKNIGNRSFLDGKAKLLQISDFDVLSNDIVSMTLEPNGSSMISYEVKLSNPESNELLFSLLLTDDDGFLKRKQFGVSIVEINKELAIMKAKVEERKLEENRKKDMIGLVKLSQIATSLNIEGKPYLPEKLPEIERVTKVNVEEIFSDLRIHWEGVQGRDYVVTKHEKASIEVSIENLNPLIDSFQLLFNTKPIKKCKNLVKDSYNENVFESKFGLSTFVSSEMFLLDGRNTFSFKFYINGNAFEVDDTFTYQFEEEKGTLHLVSIGVPDLIGDSKERLKFTAKDASDFIKTFKSSTVVDDYGEIKEYLYNVDENTTQTSIMKFIREFDLEVNSSKDLLVFYLSSHGFISQNNGELYISTSDYDHKSKEFSCINFQDVILLKLLNISCSKLLLLDVCHSGAIINESGDEGVSEESKKINQFLQKKVESDQQLYMVSSSNAGQYSYEFESLQNSAFMKAITESIENKSYSACSLGEILPDQNDDGVLNLSEMIKFISTRVPCIVKSEKKDAKQHPLSKKVVRDLKLFDYF